MTIQIPQGAKTMQIFDMEINVPEGKSFLEIDDSFLQSKYKQFMQSKEQNKTMPQAPFVAPQAPAIPKEFLEANAAQEPKTWSESINDSLTSFNKKMRKINEALNPTRVINEIIDPKNIAKALDYLSPRETSGEAGARQKIADTHSQIAGGLINQAFTTLSDEEQRQIFKVAYDEIKKLGYEPFIEMQNGEYKYIGVAKNGKEVDFTPSFGNKLASNKNELALSVAGGMAGNLAKTAGQSLLRKGANYFIPSALGSSVGAGADLYSQSQNTGIEASASDYAKRMASAALEDALGGAVIGAGIKGVTKSYKGIKDLIKGGNKAIQTGSELGKNMIDGMATNASHLKENLADRFRKLSPSVVNDVASGGVETSKTYAKDMIESAKGDYNAMLENARINPLEVNQGNAIIDSINDKIRFANASTKNAFVKNLGDKTNEILKELSQKTGSKEAALSQQDLLNLSFMNDDLAKIARDVLANDPKIANKLANALSGQDEALLKELKLNQMPKANELYALREARANRAYEEFSKGLENLDKMSPKGVRIDKEAINEIIENSSVYSEATPAIVKKIVNEARSGALNGKSVKELNDRISAITKKLEGEKSYNYKDFLNSLKDEFLESIVRNADNPQGAKELLSKIRKDYAAFKTYDKSKIGKELKGSEENISKELNKILKETNPKKNYEAVVKSLNDAEVKTLDHQIITRAIQKHKVNLGDKANEKLALNYNALLKELENFNPKSKTGQEQMEVLKTIGRLRTSFETIADGILNAKMKEVSAGISPNIAARFKTMFVNTLTDYIAFVFLRMLEIGKRAGTRIQMRRAFSNVNTLKDFDKASKEFISSIKEKTLKEEALKARSEFNAKVKDLIQGDNFVMYESKGAKSDLKAKMSLAPNVRDLAKLTSDEIVADLEYLAHKHKEMFKKPSDVFKLIKEVKDNPTFFYKNNRMDIALIAKRLKDDKLGKLGINKDSGEVRHITKSRNADKENERIIKRDGKNPLVESPYSTQPVLSKDAEPTAYGADALSKGNNENSTQTKPKKSLIERLNEDIKAKNEFRANLLENLTKELKAKNGTQNLKSIKEKSDEKIKADTKAKNEFMQDYKKALDEKIKGKVKNIAKVQDDNQATLANKNIVAEPNLKVDKAKGKLKNTNLSKETQEIFREIDNFAEKFKDLENEFEELRKIKPKYDKSDISAVLSKEANESREKLLQKHLDEAKNYIKHANGAKDLKNLRKKFFEAIENKDLILNDEKMEIVKKGGKDLDKMILEIVEPNIKIIRNNLEVLQNLLEEEFEIFRKKKFR